MTKFSMIATAALFVIAAPAVAIAKDAPQPKSETEAAPVDGKTRVCMNVAPVTGTILTRRVCKTADEWRAEGAQVGRIADAKR